MLQLLAPAFCRLPARILPGRCSAVAIGLIDLIGPVPGFDHDQQSCNVSMLCRIHALQFALKAKSFTGWLFTVD
jgi:hypothetical protein